MSSKKCSENTTVKNYEEMKFGWGFDPLLSLITLKISTDEMFSEIFINKASLQKETIYHPKTNLYILENNYHIEIELPGFNEENIRFHLSKDYVILYAKNYPAVNVPENYFSVKERKIGTHIKNIQLKHDIDAENFEASFKNGLLRISVAIKNT